MMNNQLARLMDAVLSSWVKVIPRPLGNQIYTPVTSVDGTQITFCNEFVQDVLNKLGCKLLNGMTANEMTTAMASDLANWLAVPGLTASIHAAHGSLVVAGWINPVGHGHVALVIPGECVSSGKWNENDQVPKVASVGTYVSTGIGIGANWAFGPEPKYYVLKSTIVED